jgi:hypothetical protein
MKIDPELRKYTQIQKRLAVSDGPEGRRRTTTAAGFAGLSKMSCSVVPCDILNVSRRNFTKMGLYKEFQYNIDCSERFGNASLLSNSR